MTVGELPVGCKIQMGVNVFSQDDEDIIWVKVNDLGDFMAELPVTSVHFDSTEIDNTSRERRSGGNNYYPHSNVSQWLNSANENWFNPSHRFDAIRRYPKRGFLDCFSDKERAHMIPREIVCAVPLGSIKEFGRSVTMTQLVSLPSAYELGVEYDEYIQRNEEGDRFAENVSSNRCVMTRTWTRDAKCVVGVIPRTAGTSTYCANESVWVCPVIRLAPDTVLSGPKDCHYIEDAYNEVKIDVSDIFNVSNAYNPGVIRDSWAEINASCADGSYKDKYHVGDRKAVRSANDIYYAEIVAIDADKGVEGSATMPHLTFIMDGPLDYPSVFAASTAVDSFAQTDLPNLISDTARKLPDDLLQSVKNVEKSFSYFDSDDDAVQENVFCPKFWIPSSRELGFSEAVESSDPVYDLHGCITKHCGESTCIRWFTRSMTGHGEIVVVDSNGAFRRKPVTAGSAYIILGFCI